MKTLTIDYDKKPSRIDLAIESHSNKKGKVKLNLEDIKLYSALKLDESWIAGNEYLKRLKSSGKVLLDARVMEELLASPESIPEDWRDKAVFFWGTIFRGGGLLYVAYLVWLGNQWVADYRWLDGDFRLCHPAAVLASPALGDSVPSGSNLEPLELEISVSIKGVEYKGTVTRSF